MTAAVQCVLVSPTCSDDDLLPLAGVDVVRGHPGSEPRATALVCDPVTHVGVRELDAMPLLRVISVAGSGTDAIDTAGSAQRGIRILSCGPVLADATADVAIGLLIAAARQFVEGDRLVRSGGWTGWAFDAELGQDISGATLGLVGYGSVGRAVARRARALGMNVLHHTRRDSGEAGWVADLDRLLQSSQHVSLHVPLTPQTRHLLDRRRLALLRPTSVVVNTARGAVVDEQALVDALEAGTLFGAGLDVYEQEPTVSERVLNAPRTVLLPHVGSATPRVRQRMLRAALTAVARDLAGGSTPPTEES